ncbi:MAG: PIN domain-containing protein [Eubacteriales bacterium]|nr:PIN domain-containing protein [Eubacteriales bacterium]
MTVQYLIDSENVGDFWIPLLDLPAEETHLVVFYTRNSPHMSYESLIKLKESDRTVTFIKCYEGTNALDFQLVSELGYRISKDEDGRFVIVTNDTGFDAAVKYWRRRKKSVKRITGKECRNLERRAREDLAPDHRAHAEEERVPAVDAAEEQEARPAAAADKTVQEQEVRSSRPNLRDAESAACPEPEESFAGDEAGFEDYPEAEEDAFLPGEEEQDALSMYSFFPEDTDESETEEYSEEYDEADASGDLEGESRTEQEDFEEGFEGEFFEEPGEEYDSVPAVTEEAPFAEPDQEGMSGTDPAAEPAAGSGEEQTAEAAAYFEEESEAEYAGLSAEESAAESAGFSGEEPAARQETISRTDSAKEPAAAFTERRGADQRDPANRIPLQDSETAETEEADARRTEADGEDAAAGKTGDEAEVGMTASQDGAGSDAQSVSRNDISTSAEEKSLSASENAGAEEEEQPAEASHRSKSRRSRSRRSRSGSKKQEQPAEEELPAAAASGKEAAQQPAGEAGSETAASNGDARDGADFPPEEEIAKITACIGADNLAELHNQLSTFYGEAGKDIYLSIRKNSRQFQTLKPDLRQKYAWYCEIIFARSDYNEEYPEDLPDFLLSVREKMNNLNSLRYALQKKYNKEKGRRFYFLLKPYVKTMYQM